MLCGVVEANHVVLHSVPEGAQFFVGTSLEVGSIHDGYLIFTGIPYSKQIKLPTILAIQPETKTLARHEASNCIGRPTHYCSQLKVLYIIICAHFCPVYGPPLHIFCWELNLLVVSIITSFDLCSRNQILSCFYMNEKKKICVLSTGSLFSGLITVPCGS